MRTSLYSRTLAATLVVFCLPGSHPAFAQFPPAAGPPAPDSRSDRGETRPPIPPGVPTTPDNVQLPTEGEVKMGREASAEVEKVYKIIRSGRYYDRLQRVSREVLAAIQREDIVAEYKRVYHLPRPEDHSRRVPFEFSFKVVDTTKEINAFSLSGGPVYVTKGLMDYATSDDELAAVLAHEVSHVMFHHVEQLMKKQKKVQSAQLIGLLATLIAGAAGGGAMASAAGNIMMAGQLVSLATMTGYGRELESEADRVGVHALAGTRYSPVAMMTFMQKLARDERLRGNPDNGILQDHPYSNERVTSIRKELTEIGYRVDPGTQRQVSGSFRVEAVSQRLNGQEVGEVRLNGNLLFIAAAGEGDLGPAERARKIARQMEDLFLQNVTFNDVVQTPDKGAVLMKGVPVIRPYPEDAAVMGSAAAVTERAYKEILRALWREKLDMP